MFFGDKKEIQILREKIDKLTNKIDGLKNQIDELKNQIEYRDREVIHTLEKKMQMIATLYTRAMNDIDQKINNNAHLIEETLKVVKDNKIEISEIRNNQINVFGSNTNIDHDNRTWYQSASEIDLIELAHDLSKLRSAMRDESSKPEHDMAIAEIAQAEIAAKEGKGSVAFKHLRKAGKWALDVANKIGVGIAVAALKTTLGL